MDVYSSPQAEYGRLEQILLQFLLKSLHIILDSRIPSIRPHGRISNTSGSQAKKSDKWFSLVLGDRPPALDNLNFWHKNLMEPLVIDIILVQEIPNFSSGQSPSSGLGKFVETVIERWVVQYEHLRTMSPQIGEPSASYKKTYKKSIILLRSLYSMMRLLPAQRAFRKVCSLSKACDFDINYKVSSFSAPFSREEEESMKHYNFIPVDAQQGRISISLTYRENLSDFNLETSALFPPQIITDYVGSPATDPLKSFPSSIKGFSATSVPLGGVQSPTSTPFQRPHSWTSGLHRGPHFAPNHHHYPLGGSPHAYHASSSLKNEFSSSPTDIYGGYIHNQNYKMGNRGTRGIVNEDNQLSPPFSPSPSPSPSPPTYPSGGNFMATRRHSETAPVSIPHPMMAQSPRYLSPNLSDPTRQSLPPQSPKSTKLDPSSHDSSSGIRSLRKSDSSRAGESYSGIINYYSGQKLSRDSKEDSGRFSGLLSSSGSPRIGFSRSSSRLSFQEDLDDFDFSCPFIVDDVDTSDSQASPNLDGNKGSESTSHGSLIGKKSQDAAVGALVHMLRTAPPLRQDSSCYTSRNEPQGEFGTASEVYRARKASDALEELQSYRKMKDDLLSKSGIIHFDDSKDHP